MVIYGDEEVSELVERIRLSGWINPLIVTPDLVIISDHRHWKAVSLLRWETVPVEVRKFPDQKAELEALLLENASRIKTTEQKTREGLAWEEIEKEKARDRQRMAAHSTNQRRCSNAQGTLCEKFHTASKGRMTEVIAYRIGLGSGRTYQKAASVVVHSDESANLGHQEVAQVLLKTLNEQSVDAAHALLKKTPEELQALANLIISGKAKSIRQAVKMINQNNSSGSNNANNINPSQPSLAGFSIGDWVEVSKNAYPLNLLYIGRRGRVEQILAAEQQISVTIQGVDDKVRFSPNELSLLVRAAPQNTVHISDIVFVDIDRHEAASLQDKRWNGYWGKVTSIGEMGSLTVDVGKESLQLFPRDIKPIDAPTAELRSVVERVLHLRRLELDEAEVELLSLFQRREWLTPRQLDYLHIIEKFHLKADSHKNEKHQVVQFRGR